MRVTLIYPPLVHQQGDPFGGIPAMPTGLAYLAAWLRRAGHEVTLIDAFGEAPRRAETFREKYVARGLSLDEIVARIPAGAELVGIGCHSGAQHNATLILIRKIKDKLGVPVAVGGHHPTAVSAPFLEAGADFVVKGEGEIAIERLCDALAGKIKIEDVPGLILPRGKETPAEEVKNLDDIPFPAIDLLPLEYYWALGLSHGPVRGRHIFMISSRGCPYSCRFCTTPGICGRRWRARSADNVVDEMEEWLRRYGVRDFHFQDENFGVSKKRVLEICDEIVRRRLAVSISLPSGIKAETIDEEVVRALRRAGCRYICLAPESGSERVLKLMDKPLDFAHTEKLVRLCRKLRIRTGLFFILGYPGETEEDRKKTARMISRLTRLGADEFSIFIFTPLPGAAAWEDATDLHGHWKDYEELCWSPRWRPDYKELSRWRRRLYLRYALTKAVFHPLSILRNLWNTITGRFETKGEMTVRRMFRTTGGKR
jgi:anaerobic magnesium-protoporphyrin IX monomethyl ester cyclase